jgi:hypothetical protein
MPISSIATRLGANRVASGGSAKLLLELRLGIGIASQGSPRFSALSSCLFRLCRNRDFDGGLRGIDRGNLQYGCELRSVVRHDVKGVATDRLWVSAQIERFNNAFPYDFAAKSFGYRM